MSNYSILELFSSLSQSCSPCWEFNWSRKVTWDDDNSWNLLSNYSVPSHTVQNILLTLSYFTLPGSYYFFLDIMDKKMCREVKWLVQNRTVNKWTYLWFDIKQAEPRVPGKPTVTSSFLHSMLVFLAHILLRSLRLLFFGVELVTTQIFKPL